MCAAGAEIGFLGAAGGSEKLLLAGAAAAGAADWKVKPANGSAAAAPRDGAENRGSSAEKHTSMHCSADAGAGACLFLLLFVFFFFFFFPSSFASIFFSFSTCRSFFATSPQESSLQFSDSSSSSLDTARRLQDWIESIWLTPSAVVGEGKRRQHMPDRTRPTAHAHDPHDAHRR